MSDHFVQCAPDDPLARPLMDALAWEYDSRYGTYFSVAGAAAEMNRYPPAEFMPPRGDFVLLLRAGQAIAGGAFMQLDASTAEFKRIWTHAAHRRQGLARKVLVELESRAQALGYRRIYLTTGFRQHEAVGLYLSTGYEALFDPAVDPEVYKLLPFQKRLGEFTQAASAGHGQPPKPFEYTNEPAAPSIGTPHP